MVVSRKWQVVDGARLQGSEGRWSLQGHPEETGLSGRQRGPGVHQQERGGLTSDPRGLEGGRCRVGTRGPHLWGTTLPTQAEERKSSSSPRLLRDPGQQRPAPLPRSPSQQRGQGLSAACRAGATLLDQSRSQRGGLSPEVSCGQSAPPREPSLVAALFVSPGLRARWAHGTPSTALAAPLFQKYSKGNNPKCSFRSSGVPRRWSYMGAALCPFPPAALLRGTAAGKERGRAPPVEDGAHPCAVGAVPVDVQPRGQEDPVLDGDGPVGEGGNEQLVPAWGRGARSGRRIQTPQPALPRPPVSPPDAAVCVTDPPLGQATPGFPNSALWNPNPAGVPQKMGSWEPMFRKCLFLPQRTLARMMKALRSPAQSISSGSV